MQRRVLVLDPLSVWWGLKSHKDGKAPGYPIPVFGGPHADIPLHDAAGAMIGELITTSGISAVLVSSSVPCNNPNHRLRNLQGRKNARSRFG
jgi:hypothetical protein